MAILNSVAECLAYIEICKNEFPILKEIINAKDLLTWEKKLAAVSSLDDFILGKLPVEANLEDEAVEEEDATWEAVMLEEQPVQEDEIIYYLNLLNVSITAGFCFVNGHENDHCTHSKRLLAKLSLYLDKFPELKSDKRFPGKIKNLEGPNFLAALSELSLAYKLASNGLSVIFETPFKLPGNANKKDVDLTVSKNGQAFHLEVYMPVQPVNIQGFFDPSEEDKHFEYKVWKKLTDKFGDEKISELNGQVLLAVNIAFMEMLRIKSTQSDLTDNYSALTALIPKHIDGLLLFVDGFGTDNSFCFDKLLLKKSPSNV